MAIRIFRFLFIFIISARIAGAQNPDASFQTRSATCHVAGNSVGAPLPETLRQMSWQTILSALEVGKMKPMGDSLSAAERETIARSLGKTASDAMSASAKCSAAPQARATGEWNGWAGWARWARPANTP